MDGRRLVAMLRDAVAQPNKEYAPLDESVLITVTSDCVTTEAHTSSASTECVYEAPPFKNAPREPVEAIFDFSDISTNYPYLSSGLVDFTFTGTSDRRYAKSCEVEGDMNGLSFQTGLELLDEIEPDDTSNETPTTTIETDIESLEALLTVYYHTGGLNSDVELRVENGDLKVDTYDDEGAHIYGNFPVRQISGPDLVNHYPYRPLMRIVRRLDDTVTLKTSPDSPLRVIHDDNTAIRRYTIAHADSH